MESSSYQTASIIEIFIYVVINTTESIILDATKEDGTDTRESIDVEKMIKSHQKVFFIKLSDCNYYSYMLYIYCNKLI